MAETGELRDRVARFGLRALRIGASTVAIRFSHRLKARNAESNLGQCVNLRQTCGAGRRPEIGKRNGGRETPAAFCGACNRAQTL